MLNDRDMPELPLRVGAGARGWAHTSSTWMLCTDEHIDEEENFATVSTVTVRAHHRPKGGYEIREAGALTSPRYDTN